MRRSNFALRLQPSLMEELRKAAEEEGVALNQLINVAVAEKVSALRTEEYFRERAQRANRSATMRILARAGRDNMPMSGDELPEDQSDETRKTKRKLPAVSRKNRPKANSQTKKARG
jgi:hypothetical protein